MKYFFLIYFLRKQGFSDDFGMSCGLSPLATIRMKSNLPYLLAKIRKTVPTACRLLIVLRGRSRLKFVLSEVYQYYCWLTKLIMVCVTFTKRTSPEQDYFDAHRTEFVQFAYAVMHVRLFAPICLYVYHNYLSTVVIISVGGYSYL